MFKSVCLDSTENRSDYIQWFATWEKSTSLFQDEAVSYN